MDKIMLWLSEYWMYAIGLVAVCVVAFFVFRAAGRAYRKYYERYRSEESKIKRLKELKDKFAQLTEETLQSANEDEILEGVALSYQVELQKNETMEEDFEELSKEKQYIYTLAVFISDGSLRTFFKENGSILTEKIVPALQMIGLDEEAALTEKIRVMYDEKDETTSLDYKEVDNAENIFKSRDILTKIKLYAAKYIKENTEKFTM